MRSSIAVMSLFACLALGCDDEPMRGAAGESCSSRDDCEDGLRCLAQVCVAAGDGGDAGTARLPGAPCVARRDCAEGLLCVDNRCAGAMAGIDATDTRYSGRGESCQAQNDCKAGLSCVQGTCRERSLPVEPTTKECVRVECASRQDCCATFRANENCEAYRDNCETDPIFCNTYRSLCECSRDCVDEMCVAAAPGCAVDAECTSQQTPFCVDDTCRQCARDANCPGEGSQCVSGVCMAPCGIDENCPPLHTCRDGECVEAGCQTDRECVFLDGDPRAICREGECLVPCDDDVDCASTEEGARFRVCIDAQCRFVGCETDAECRAFLGLASTPGQTRAECR